MSHAQGRGPVRGRSSGSEDLVQGPGEGTPSAWQIVMGIEVVALLIALIMPVTPSKTGSDWSPAELFMSDPGYFHDVLAYLVLTNILLAALAVAFVIYQRWTRGDAEP